mmetsp:Transcript_63153/g.149647  ORF Transcript_63153/g.149647 Transcript_63153/m.149647 type:complete len:206 (-) Transcript_63153:1109-1726(-)
MVETQSTAMTRWCWADLHSLAVRLVALVLGLLARFGPSGGLVFRLSVLCTRRRTHTTRVQGLEGVDVDAMAVELRETSGVLLRLGRVDMGGSLDELGECGDGGALGVGDQALENFDGRCVALVLGVERGAVFEQRTLSALSKLISGAACDAVCEGGERGVDVSEGLVQLDQRPHNAQAQRPLVDGLEDTDCVAGAALGQVGLRQR